MIIGPNSAIEKFAIPAKIFEIVGIDEELKYDWEVTWTWVRMAQLIPGTIFKTPGFSTRDLPYGFGVSAEEIIQKNYKDNAKLGFVRLMVSNKALGVAFIENEFTH